MVSRMVSCKYWILYDTTKMPSLERVSMHPPCLFTKRALLFFDWQYPRWLVVYLRIAFIILPARTAIITISHSLAFFLFCSYELQTSNFANGLRRTMATWNLVTLIVPKYHCLIPKNTSTASITTVMAMGTIEVRRNSPQRIWTRRLIYGLLGTIFTVW